MIGYIDCMRVINPQHNPFPYIHLHLHTLTLTYTYTYIHLHLHTLTLTLTYAHRTEPSHKHLSKNIPMLTQPTRKKSRINIKRDKGGTIGP